MNKSLKAFLRGYVVFIVNDEVFWLYNSARKVKEQVPKDENVVFMGFSIYKGWRNFYLRGVRPIPTTK